MIGRILWNDLDSWPVALLVLAAGLAGTFLLYPRQLASASSRSATIITLARAAAILAISAAILQPTFVRNKTVDEFGGVVVMLDRSASMSVVDAPASTAATIELAEGMGLIPSQRRARLADELLPRVHALGEKVSDFVLAQGELDYTDITGQSSDAAEQRVRDARAAVDQQIADWPTAQPVPGVAPILGKLAELLRSTDGEADARTVSLFSIADELTAVIADAQTQADERLFQSDAQIRTACEKLTGLSRFSLAERSLVARDGGLISRLKSDLPIYGFTFADTLAPMQLVTHAEGDRSIVARIDGGATDFDSALRAVLAQTIGRPISAIVMLSDGRATGPTGGVSTGGVPVFTVSVAGPVRKDVAIQWAVAPASAFVGESVNIRLQVSATNARGEFIDLVVSSGEQKVTRRVELTDDLQPLNIPLKLTQPGEQIVKIGLSSLPGELSESNNHVQRSVRVVQRKLRVASISGAGGWDSQYLRDVLARSAWIELVEQGGLSRERPLKLPFDQLAKCDVITLANVPAGALLPDEWQQLIHWNEAGGSLVLLLTDPSIVSEYAASPRLRSLLPTPEGSEPTLRFWPGDEPTLRLWKPQTTRDLGLLKLAEDPSADTRRWESLPPGFRAIESRALRPEARALLINRDTGNALLTESRVGSGRVFILGYGETWRWRRRGGERDQDRFFVELIRYAAEEPYALEKDGLSLDVPAAGEIGRSLVVRARIRDAHGAPDESSQPKLFLVKDGETVREIASTLAGPAGFARYRATLDALPAGNYEVVLRVEGKGEIRLPCAISPSVEREMTNLLGDEPTLQRIAQGTGGKMIRLGDLRSLPKLLEESRRQMSGTSEYPLWCSPYLFCFVLGCLGLEWAVRKQVGLL